MSAQGEGASFFGNCLGDVCGYFDVSEAAKWAGGVSEDSSEDPADGASDGTKGKYGLSGVFVEGA